VDRTPRRPARHRRRDAGGRRGVAFADASSGAILFSSGVILTAGDGAGAVLRDEREHGPAIRRRRRLVDAGGADGTPRCGA